MHFLEELRLAVESIDEGPKRLLIAEDSRNLNKLILPREKGGFGLDGVWADDFHHQVRHITAGDSESYFSHFAGMDARDLAETISNGWYYRGQPSRRSGKARGTETSELELDQFVICIQNHDQVGNRPLGNRLNQEIPPDVYRAASALLLFSPEIPLLFMGQEWAAETPFLYFSDHHEELGRLVTEGRKKEFEDFSAFKGEVPDPQHPDTFSRSRLDWEELDKGAHAGTLRLYRDLLAIRKMRAGSVQARAAGPYLLTLRQGPMELIVALRENQRVSIDGSPAIVLDTEDRRYTGSGDPPTISDTDIRFARAGAILLRHDSRREKN
jgi:maltooligosyltrehalose trehalohydrolase